MFILHAPPSKPDFNLTLREDAAGVTAAATAAERRKSNRHAPYDTRARAPTIQHLTVFDSVEAYEATDPKTLQYPHTGLCLHSLQNDSAYFYDYLSKSIASPSLDLRSHPLYVFTDFQSTRNKHDAPVPDVLFLCGRSDRCPFVFTATRAANLIYSKSAFVRTSKMVKGKNSQYLDVASNLIARLQRIEAKYFKIHTQDSAVLLLFNKLYS